MGVLKFTDAKTRSRTGSFAPSFIDLTSFDLKLSGDGTETI